MEKLEAFEIELEKFIGERLAADAVNRNRQRAFPRDAADLIARSGYSGLTVTGRDGAGRAMRRAVHAVTKIGETCPRSGDAAFFLNFAAVKLIAEQAVEDLRDRLLPTLVSGSRLVAMAITEDRAGTDAASLEMMAEERDDEWVIRGEKFYTALSADADGFVVLARTGAKQGSIGAFYVERDRDSVETGDVEEFLSGESWCRVRLRDVHIPAANVIIADQAFSRLKTYFDEERLGQAARALGTARCAFSAARRYATHRVQFGSTIASFQGIQWKFADMAVKISAAESLLQRCAEKADAGELGSDDALKAKLSANQTAIDVCGEAVQICGAAGYQRGTLVGICFERARGFGLNGGTLEHMRTKLGEIVLQE